MSSQGSPDAVRTSHSRRASNLTSVCAPQDHRVHQPNPRPRAIHSPHVSITSPDSSHTHRPPKTTSRRPPNPSRATRLELPYQPHKHPPPPTPPPQHKKRRSVAMSGPPPGQGPARAMSVGNGPPSAGLPPHNTMPPQGPPPSGSQGPQSQQNLNQIVSERSISSACLLCFTSAGSRCWVNGLCLSGNLPS